MVPRETGNNAYAKFWRDKQKVQWYFRHWLIGKISVHKQCFCYLTANEALVGTLMTIGDVNDVFPVKLDAKESTTVLPCFNHAIGRRTSICCILRNRVVVDS